MRHGLMACLCVACLAGCAIGPDYDRPEIDVPEAYFYMPAETADTINTEWWRQFNDPTLDALIAEALAANWDVRIAAARVEQAAAVLQITRSSLFPQLSYSAEAARLRASRNEALPAPADNPFSLFQVLAGANWELDLWGRIRRLAESDRATLLATEEARRGVILSLVAQVASSYIDLLSLDEQLAIAQRTLKVYGETLNMFELRFQYGQASQMIVEQARSQYQTAAETIPALENQIAQTENALSVLLGRNPGPIVRESTLSELSVPPIPKDVPSDLLERRPDILQAEQNLVAANALIGAAQALYFPTIALTGTYGVASQALDNLFRGSSRTWSYAGTATGPIFTAGAITGQVKEAKANEKAALFAYEQAIQRGFADVESSLVARQKLGEQLPESDARVKALQEYTRLAWLQFNEGYTPYLTVLYAEQQLFPAELDNAQVRAQELTAVINVYKSLGGGWVIEAEKMTVPPGQP